ncbi:hypothetical protein C0J52_23275 [Blattella germanica]|nr:hypothetical protein C0J52_23275 [Blattella germanica]
MKYIKHYSKEHVHILDGKADRHYKRTIHFLLKPALFVKEKRMVLFVETVIRVRHNINQEKKFKQNYISNTRHLDFDVVGLGLIP